MELYSSHFFSLQEATIVCFFINVPKCHFKVINYFMTNIFHCNQIESNCNIFIDQEKQKYVII
ncbi:hypothetical protein BCR25_02555 [Enterococcus termitis]|uniref:Uncharacterized protein n=1 Tax=Enterococcus termitis TaxID=332950 RepID=A0A1E5H779_9ENTE|nr:hypothetical protein BCR25_02555 [Enterococcus termitis]